MTYFVEVKMAGENRMLVDVEQIVRVTEILPEQKKGTMIPEKANSQIHLKGGGEPFYVQDKIDDIRVATVQICARTLGRR